LAALFAAAVGVVAIALPWLALAGLSLTGLALAALALLTFAVLLLRRGPLILALLLLLRVTVLLLIVHVFSFLERRKNGPLRTPVPKAKSEIPSFKLFLSISYLGAASCVSPFSGV
jgi:hypothetical protein